MGRGMGARADLRLRPDGGARPDLLDRHSPADGLGLAARRARLLLHPHRSDRPLPADARQGRLLPDGLGRQRSADRTPGAELLRRALRSLVAARSGLHPARQARCQAPAADLAPQLRRAVRGADRTGRAGLRTALAPVGAERGLVHALHHDQRRRPDGRPARVPAQPGPRRGLLRRGAEPVGRHLPDRRRPGRTRGTRDVGALPPGRLPPRRRLRSGARRDHSPRTHPGGRRPDRPPGRRALSAPVRHHRQLSPVRGGDPGPGPRRRRDGQGRRHRDVLHLRRPDRRPVVARTRPAHPGRRPPGRTAARRDAGLDRGGPRRGAVRRAARREDHVQRPDGDRRGAAGDRRPGRRAEPDQPDRQLLREGRQAPGDRHLPTVVHPQRGPGRRAPRVPDQARPGADLDPGAHVPPLRELGQRAERRLADQPAAVLRRPVPALVPGRHRREHRLRRPDHPGRRRPARRSLRRCRTGVRGADARLPRGFRRRPGRHGHLGDVVAVPAAGHRVDPRLRAVRQDLPDGPAPAGRTTSSGPGCSRASSGPTSSTGRCRGRTPRSPGSWSTRTARR